jgi:hypothetical protein
LLSLLGNAADHLIAVRLVTASWVVVVAVGAVPALVLGLVSHLAVLRTQTEDFARESGLKRSSSPIPQAVPRTGVRTEDGPRYAGEDELLAAARATEQTYRAQFGRGITRDALRRELRIGGNRATGLLRQIRNEATSPGTSE